MLDSMWLDIAIGVALVWFLFSLVVTGINEVLTRLFGFRSNQLWLALQQMLDGKKPPKNPFARFFTLFKLGARPTGSSPASNTEKLYATATVQAIEPRADETKRTRISKIPSQVFSQALIEAGVMQGKTLEQNIDDLGDVPLKPQLQAIATTVDNDLKEFRGQVERWFDGQMERLSAIYKARIRIVLLIVGIAVSVIAFGAGLRSDSLALVNDLQHDSNYRRIVVDAASSATSTDLLSVGCPGK